MYVTTPYGACLAVGGWPFYSEGFVMTSRKEGIMVTYSDLFQLGIFIVAIIGLVYEMTKK